MPRELTDSLRVHKSGNHFKRIRGRYFYFGHDRKEAYREWLRCKPYILAGEPIPPKQAESADDGEAVADDRPTVGELGNKYHDNLMRRIETGSVSQRHVNQIVIALRRFVEIVGRDRVLGEMAPLEWADVRDKLTHPVARKKPPKRTDDRPKNERHPVGRQARGKRAPETVAGDVRRIRAFVTWCHDAELIPAPRWAKFFSPSSGGRLPSVTEARGFKGFDPKELRKIIRSSTVHQRPVILLAINSGVGAADIAEIPLSMADMFAKSDFVDMPRLKTGAERRFWLWPETKKAIADYIIWRPRIKAAEDADRMFVTKQGEPWVRVEPGRHRDAIGPAFVRLRKNAKLDDGTFYDLRRQFQTIAAETLDFPTVSLCMGHKKRPRDMSSRYTLAIGDDRIRKVCEHVRGWLFDE
jgi:integrase